LLHIADTVSSNALVTMRTQNSFGYAEFGTQSNYARLLSNGTLLYAGQSSQHFHYIGGSTAMTLNGTGLGIGTSPASKLDLGGSTSGQRLTFSNTGVNTTNGARTQAEIGYKTGSYGGAAVIKILTETQYDDSMALAFHTGTSAAETMRIDSSQNVGIGTSSPGNKLEVRGDIAVAISDTQDIIKLSDAGNDGSIEIYTGEATPTLRTKIVSYGDTYFNAASTGRVGIGTASPAEKLHVVGDVRIDTDLYIQPTNKFYLDGGLDTYIKESSANVMEFYCADSRRMQLTTTYLQVPDGAYLAAGNDNDIFIRHDGNGHLQSNAGTMFINQVSNNSMIFSTSNTERIRINGNGNIGIANISPYEKLDVKSASSTSPAIVANGASANGSFNMAHGYDGANGDYVCTYSTQYSTVGMVLGYGVKASTTASDTFLCSADNSNFTRGAVVLTDTLKFWTAGAQTGTLNNNITMTERFRVTPAGVGHFDNDVVAYSSTVSDKRLKENITTIDNALDKVMALRGVEYDWTATSRKGTHDIGLVAQEVEEVLPELVTEHELCTGEFGGEGNEKTFKTVNYDKMVGVLIEAIKEQQEQINELKEKLNG